MDLTTMPVDQLKVMAYDMIAQSQMLQSNLAAVNQEIARRPPPPPAGSDASEVEMVEP